MEEKKLTIPKVIHYCWFGNSEMSDCMKKCLKSWSHFCPDFEIKRWDESNFDIEQNNYVIEAYQSHKYAFVSDVARFDILYKNGGIYLDTDVELLKPLDDLLDNKTFFGTENGLVISPGLIIGARAGDPFLKEILDYYNRISFFDENGFHNETTVVEYVTEIARNYGYEGNESIVTLEPFMVYPKDYFCPLTLNSSKTDFTKNTYAIHYFAGSWKSNTESLLFGGRKGSVTRKLYKLIKRGLILIIGERYFKLWKHRVKEILK